jgi:hypothetical protein
MVDAAFEGAPPGRPGERGARPAPGDIARRREVALVELADRVLDGGVVVSGEIALSAAGVDLVHVSVRADIAPAPVASRDGTPPARDDARPP